MAIAPNVSIFYYSCLMFAYDQVTPHDLSDVFFTILLYFMSIVYHPVAYILEMIAKVAPPSQASPFGATSNCIYILLIVNKMLLYCTCICQFGNKLLLLLLRFIIFVAIYSGHIGRQPWLSVSIKLLKIYVSKIVLNVLFIVEVFENLVSCIY